MRVVVWENDYATCLTYPLGDSVLNKVGAEKLERNYIETFVLVIIDDAYDAASRLVDIFDCEETGDGDVVDRFYLVVDSDVRRKRFGDFEADVEVFTNVDGDEGL